MTRLEHASFEVERFELAEDACLEVSGRWFGVRGRRFMRPTLTTMTDGREQRILAVLDHKPWSAEEGETWLAAFPCSTDPTALVQAELTVAPDVTVPLPPPSTPATVRRSRRAALEARDSAIAERHESIESEVELRLEALRAEAERDRAGARLAAQTARERDEARAGREEAIRERNEAREERDHAQRARNRMLAERDTARTQVEDVTRQWELTAGIGTRRTVERDALAVERDRLTRERDAVLEERDRIVRERDAALEARDRVAHEREAARQEGERIAHERESALVSHEPEFDKPTLVLSERRLVTSEPRAQPGRSHNATGTWRARLLAVSALLVALVILVVLLLTE